MQLSNDFNETQNAIKTDCRVKMTTKTNNL